MELTPPGKELFLSDFDGLFCFKRGVVEIKSIVNRYQHHEMMNRLRCYDEQNADAS